MDVTIQGEGIRYANSAEDDDELTICEDAQDWHVLEMRENRTNDLRNGVTFKPE